VGDSNLIRAIATFLLPAMLVATPRFDFALMDTVGVRHTASEWTQARAVVLFFVGVDCPLSNEYAPEMNRLDAEYEPRGVRVYAVASDATAAAGDVDAVRRYAKAFALRMPVLLDPRGLLAEHTGADVTPEAAVLSSNGTLLYVGRIDNRVEKLGTHRPVPTHFDLRESIDAVLAGKPVPHARTTAVGCFLPARAHTRTDQQP
jgi:peroxiredoxin